MVRLSDLQVMPPHHVLAMAYHKQGLKALIEFLEASTDSDQATDRMLTYLQTIIDWDIDTRKFSGELLKAHDLAYYELDQLVQSFVPDDD